MTIVADLHLHTSCSDGVLSPKEVVDIAIKKKLKAISITDHDAFDGIEVATEYADGALEIIPGVELSTEYDGGELHILGYFMNVNDKTLLSEMDRFKHAREERARKIVQKLAAVGVNVDFDDISRIAGDAAIGRPHVARALVEAGHADNTWDVFDRYLGDNGVAYVPKFKISPEKGIELIRAAGGIAVWAHPKVSICETIIDQLVVAGLDGVEAFHPKHSNEDTCYLLEVAKRHSLIVTGGSDFHDHESGRDIGDFGISESHYKTFIRLGRRNV